LAFEVAVEKVAALGLENKMRSLVAVVVIIMGLSIPIHSCFAKDRLWSAFAWGVRESDSFTVIATSVNKLTREEALSEARAACVNQSGDEDHCFGQVYDKCYYVFTLRYRSVTSTPVSNSLAGARQTMAIECHQDGTTCSDIKPVCNK
jgi:hypothetical protein